MRKLRWKRQASTGANNDAMKCECRRFESVVGSIMEAEFQKLAGSVLPVVDERRKYDPSMKRRWSEGVTERGESSSDDVYSRAVNGGNVGPRIDAQTHV